MARCDRLQDPAPDLSAAMFVHSGASLHGHEYSQKPTSPQPPPGPRRAPLLRSAFAPSGNTAGLTPASPSFLASSPSSVVRSSSVSSDTRRPGRSLSAAAGTSRVRPVSETFYSSSSRRAAEHPVVRFQDPVIFEQPSPSGSRSPSVATARSSFTHARSRSQSHPQPQSRLRPRALSSVPDPMSEDESSYSASEASYLSDQASVSAVSRPRERRRRRAPRKSTTFLLAHPAPKLRTKKQLLQRIRPTLLLQLQQLSPDRRPLPLIDVYPSSLIAGDVVAPRFSKRFPRLFGVKGELGLHDTILVRSDNYSAQSSSLESEGEDDDLDERTLLAVLSPLRREDRAEIVLEDGTVWVASPLPTGSYDFVRVDPFGNTTTARWVRRPVKAAAGGAAQDGAEGCEGCKFTFSIIDPRTRRHPILATLTSSTLDILDRYTTVSPLNGRYPPSRSRTVSPAPTAETTETAATSSTTEADRDSHQDSHSRGRGNRLSGSGPPAAQAKERTTLPVDGALKDLISITAIWVALRQGWPEAVANSSSAAASPMCPVSTAANASSLSIARRTSASGSNRRHRNSLRRSETNAAQLSAEIFSAAENCEARGRRLLGSLVRGSSSRASSPTRSGAVAAAASASATAATPAAAGTASTGPTAAATAAASTAMTAVAPLMAERAPSPSLSPAMASRAPTFPRKPVSTGAAFVQRRKQQMQLSDTSDSERHSMSAVRRSSAFSRLSGDFSARMGSTSKRKSASPPGNTLAPEPSWPRLSPASSVRQSQTSSTLVSTGMPEEDGNWGGARRSVSAHYPTNPLTQPTFMNTNASASMIDRQVYTKSPFEEAGRERKMASAPMPNAHEDGGAKWKKLGHWIKKLGGGGR